MGDLVRSLGGPILVMDMMTWKKWGGNFSNSATGFSGTDYDFVCQARGYISAQDIGKDTFLILNDIPMDTGFCKLSDGEAVIIRIMNGDIENLDQFVLNERSSMLAPRNQIEDELVEFFYVRENEMIIVESSASADCASSDDTLHFELDRRSYLIKTYEYETDLARVIAHHMLPR